MTGPGDRGPYPMCAKCGLREALSYRAGALCEPCKQLNYLRARKAAAEALEVAKRLYAVDRDRYKPVFEFINSSIKQQRRADLTLKCVRQLEMRERHSQVADVRSYLSGMIRRLLEAEDAESFRRRRGGDDFIRDFTGKIIEAIRATNQHPQPSRRSRNIGRGENRRCDRQSRGK